MRVSPIVTVTLPVTVVDPMEHQPRETAGAVPPDAQLPSKKRRILKPCEWEAQRANIERKYSLENKTLNGVLRELEKEGFSVTYGPVA